MAVLDQTYWTNINYGSCTHSVTSSSWSWLWWIQSPRALGGNIPWIGCQSMAGHLEHSIHNLGQFILDNLSTCIFLGHGRKNPVRKPTRTKKEHVTIQTDSNLSLEWNWKPWAPCIIWDKIQNFIVILYNYLYLCITWIGNICFVFITWCGFCCFSSQMSLRNLFRPLMQLGSGKSSPVCSMVTTGLCSFLLSYFWAKKTDRQWQIMNIFLALTNDSLFTRTTL